MNREQQTLHDILSLGISHLEFIRKQLTELKLSEEDTPDTERAKQAQFLMNAASVINDIMHPAYPMIKDIFPDEQVHKLIEYYIFLHDKHPARKEDFQCPCIACVHDSSTNTDQKA